MEREITLDTETTGLDPSEKHRIIEIGCVELVNRVPTGNNFHAYINPQRDVPEVAVNIHGLTEEFLSDKPLFSDVAEDFLNFIGDSKLIIHNADFDTKFLNSELKKIRRPMLDNDRIFCTLKFARQKFPGSPNSLDALCRRFGIDNSHRTLHGALLDSEILAEVYLELMGGKQVSINLDQEKSQEEKKDIQKTTDENHIIERNFKYRKFELADEEKEQHKKFIGEKENSLWKKYS